MDNDNIKRSGPSFYDSIKEYGKSKLAPSDFCHPARFEDGSVGCKYNWKLNLSSDFYIIYSSKHKSGAHFILSINKETGVVKIVKTHIENFTLFKPLDPRDCLVIYQDVVESIRDIEIVLDNNVDQDRFFKREDVKMQEIKDVMAKFERKLASPQMDVFTGKGGVITYYELLYKRPLTDEEKNEIEEGMYKFVNGLPVKI